MKHQADPTGLVHDFTTGLDVDVYPVGVLGDLRYAYRSIRYLGDYRGAYRKMRYGARYVASQARRGNWRAVRSSFNGYLAEPIEWPDGLKGCGHGWTHPRAMRSLRRRARRECTTGGAR